MAAATTHELTLHLPQNVIEMVRRVATERQESPDQIVAEALSFALDPMRQDALQRLNKQIWRQKSQSDLEIRVHLDSKLAEPEQQRLSHLLERNRTVGLGSEEQAEMQQLFDQIEKVATEKAAAIWLLSSKSAPPDARP
jgi:hypothetical protein